jgi:hypothetical protein
MRFILYNFTLLLLIMNGSAQGQSQVECGTTEKQSWFEILKVKSQHYSYQQRGGGQAIIVPYQIHLIQASNGSSNLTLAEIYAEIDSVNHFYANAGLVFIECIAPQIINDDYYYEFDYTLHNADVLNQFYTNNIVNMYFANTVTSSSGAALCGYSQFPPSEDYVVMAANCATNGSTLAHELGHLFGLPHTHGGSSDELVDGSNCATEGDFICDTPADPTLSNTIVNSNCIYTGTATDANGMPYAPDPNNIMSYSRKNCRDYFSPMQYATIYSTYSDYRNYLFCSFPTAKNKKNKTLDLILFPNPGQHHLHLNLANNQLNATIIIYNNTGSMVYQAFCNDKFKTISTENWANGIYFYKLINVKGEEINGKWIKN